MRTQLNSNPSLQIRIYGVDGSSSVFTQDDAVTAERMVTEAQHPGFFAQDRIIIAGRSSLTTFVVSRVSRLDLRGEGISVRKAKTPFKAPYLMEISKSDFLLALEERDLKHTERKRQQRAPGQQFEGFLDIQMISGEHLFLRVIGEAALPAERMQRINYYLTAQSLSFRLSDGGLGIVNLANALKVTSYPGPAEVPADVWLANETVKP